MWSKFVYKPVRHIALLLSAGSAFFLLGACSMPGKSVELEAMPQVEEKFGSAAVYSRLFDASPVQVCEAARRALLSQGYVVKRVENEVVEGQKNFQPQPNRHVEMNIRVTCVSDSIDGQLSMGFVSALQDSYALKMSSSSASVGVSMLGSVSVPLMAGHDSMIKIGRETVTSGNFYDSFFELINRYLIVDFSREVG